MSETFTTLVACTSNLPEYLADAMEGGKEIGLPFDSLPYGYRIYVGGDDMHKAPAEISELLSAAKAAGHRWVEFDCDAEPDASYTIWEW